MRPTPADRFTEVYAGGQPVEYTQKIKGRPVYDPRLDSTREGGSGSHRQDDPSTWEWSNNAALVIADFLAGQYGYDLGYDGINWDITAYEADISDIIITSTSGATRKTWTISASLPLTDVPKKVYLDEMLKTCDGFI